MDDERLSCIPMCIRLQEAKVFQAVYRFAPGRDYTIDPLVRVCITVIQTSS